METLGLNLIYLVFLYGEVILMCSLSWLGSSRVSVRFTGSMSRSSSRLPLNEPPSHALERVTYLQPFYTDSGHHLLGVLAVRGTGSQC